MQWLSAARPLGVALMVASGTLALTRPASAQGGIERVLAGIRLNSTAKSVLEKFGNPNEVIIGEVGVRAPQNPQGGAAGQTAMLGGGMMGPPAGMGSSAMGARMGAMMGGGGGGMRMQGSAATGGMGGGMMGGPPSGATMGPPAGMTGGGLPGMPSGFSGSGRPSGMGMMGSGRMGAMGRGGFGGGRGDDDGAPMSGSMGGGPIGGFGGGGGLTGSNPGIGPFGQTTSTTSRQQEVTWIYNRKIKDAKGADQLISYEFLIGPEGKVSQIRVLGYTAQGIKTQRGVTLGSTYRDVIRLYGIPESHQVGGDNILVASYKNKAHVQFQFQNQKEQSNPLATGNRVIAITIAAIE
jgi:hypothetical protein